ncbi:hypothetical protein [Xanthomonas sacchari]|uniref:hypothetical protein n=1 Tax=Xanthomonas sacchari TaxID=56458 RepID=UPI00224F1AAB|nr:hypothetical protein [Xanthomonas sacchari]
MRIEVRIRQSEIRFRSGIKLILFVAVAASIAWIINVLWLAKLLLFLLYFFLSLRYLNFLMLVGLRKGCNDYWLLVYIELGMHELCTCNKASGYVSGEIDFGFAEAA